MIINSTQLRHNFVFVIRFFENLDHVVLVVVDYHYLLDVTMRSLCNVYSASEMTYIMSGGALNATQKN